MLHVFDIQRFSVQDGPGIRTTVFLKGCGVGCLWCHNPESISSRNQLLYYAEKCVGCGACAGACGQGVHRIAEEGHTVLREKCIACGACSRICPAEALAIAGYAMGTEELLKKIARDRAFYQSTGGGVTFSGGEPLLQAEQLQPVMRRCRQAGISTAVETSGYTAWDAFEMLLDTTELFLYDLKCGLDQTHRQVTNIGNRMIQQNLTRLFQRGKRIWIRIPVIPGVNDNPAELGKMAQLIRQGGNQAERVELMPYHDIGKSKYAALGLEYPFEARYGRGENARQRAEYAAAFLEEQGICAVLS